MENEQLNPNQQPNKEENRLATWLKRHPQYVLAFIAFVVGFFVKMPDSSMVPIEYVKTWSGVVLALGCFFPFVISAISSRQAHATEGPFNLYTVIRLFSLLSLGFGIGLLLSDWFAPNVFNTGFIAYGTGGLAGIFLNKLFTRK